MVIMDGVFNHVSAGTAPDTGFPYHWLYFDPTDSPYTGGYAQGGYFEDLDYHNGCTEQLIKDVCRFWLDSYALDGIRFDYTIGYYQPNDLATGLGKLMGDLRDELDASDRPDVVLLLEHMSDNRFEAIDVTNRVGADGCWFDRFHWDVPEAARAGSPPSALIRTLDAAQDFAPNRWPVTYLENHDHASLVHRMGGRDLWWMTQPAAIALYTTAGAVLIHNGQEFGQDVGMPEDGDGRVLPRPVIWAL